MSEDGMSAELRQRLEYEKAYLETACRDVRLTLERIAAILDEDSHD